MECGKLATTLVRFGEFTMKNFVAGVLVTSSLLLVGFQGKKPKTRYSYQWQLAGPFSRWQSQFNTATAKGGRLVQVANGADSDPRYFFWEFEK